MAEKGIGEAAGSPNMRFGALRKNGFSLLSVVGRDYVRACLASSELQPNALSQQSLRGLISSTPSMFDGQDSDQPSVCNNMDKSSTDTTSEDL
ncbi:hypothetical protein [Roseovarius nanhaiticus]|uniref:hypothetical protein n=1 Tax=Roseovarius nanhaiticus TaxID=573024 RepID=UPI00248F8EEB|nr:hypothetical protein [Roseovarius nanhaiticus]